MSHRFFGHLSSFRVSFFAVLAFLLVSGSQLFAGPLVDFHFHAHAANRSIDVQVHVTLAKLNCGRPQNCNTDCGSYDSCSYDNCNYSSCDGLGIECYVPRNCRQESSCDSSGYGDRSSRQSLGKKDGNSNSRLAKSESRSSNASNRQSGKSGGLLGNLVSRITRRGNNTGDQQSGNSTSTASSSKQQSSTSQSTDTATASNNAVASNSVATDNKSSSTASNTAKSVVDKVSQVVAAVVPKPATPVPVVSVPTVSAPVVATPVVAKSGQQSSSTTTGNNSSNVTSSNTAKSADTSKSNSNSSNSNSSNDIAATTKSVNNKGGIDIDFGGNIQDWGPFGKNPIKGLTGEIISDILKFDSKLWDKNCKPATCCDWCNVVPYPCDSPCLPPGFRNWHLFDPCRWWSWLDDHPCWWQHNWCHQHCQHDPDCDPPTSVPEPGSVTLLGIALVLGAGAGYRAKRRRKSDSTPADDVA